jgi:hypothetical protein
MIDVSDRSNVYVRLAAIKFFLAHDCSLSSRYRILSFCTTHRRTLSQKLSFLPAHAFRSS